MSDVDERNRIVEAVRLQGQIEGTIAAILTVLETRGCRITEAQRARLVEERDPARLAAWLVAAATCTDAATVFDGN